MDDMGASIALGLCLFAKRDRLGRAAQGFLQQLGWMGCQMGWQAGRQMGRWMGRQADWQVGQRRAAERVWLQSPGPNNALVRNGASDK